MTTNSKTEKPKNRSSLIRNAGEYFVMGELLKQGVSATLSPGNAVAYDILAVHLDTHKTVNIRVKTKTKQSAIFLWNAKKDGKTIFNDMSPREQKDDFCVLVYLPENIQETVFYIIPTARLDEILKEKHSIWLNTPGAKGQKHNDNPIRSVNINNRDDKYNQPFEDEYESYKNNWEILWQ